MTLVVARIAGSRIAIVSDTLLTEHDRPLPVQNGIVKSCMLPGDICVSFCNSPETADQYFREFSQQYPKGTGFANVVSFFERSSKDTGNDYLIAFSNPPRLIKIADGKRNNALSKTLYYQIALTEKIGLQTSGENEGYSIAQVSPGFMGVNLVAFYYVKAKKLFLFYTESFGLPIHCKVFDEVPATEIHHVLTNFFNFDLRWLVTVVTGRSTGVFRPNVNGIADTGVRLGFFVEANTYPSPTGSVSS